jgi:hypothetical protein
VITLGRDSGPGGSPFDDSGWVYDVSANKITDYKCATHLTLPSDEAAVKGPPSKHHADFCQEEVDFFDVNPIVLVFGHRHAARGG